MGVVMGDWCQEMGGGAIFLGERAADEVAIFEGVGGPTLPPLLGALPPCPPGYLENGEMGGIGVLGRAAVRLCGCSELTGYYYSA
ncbi:MAG: hypothetical protein Gyms2KO_34790 [Gymnodinialimonas sp.]